MRPEATRLAVHALQEPAGRGRFPFPRREHLDVEWQRQRISDQMAHHPPLVVFDDLPSADRQRPLQTAGALPLAR
jgi:hypothetical protein